MKPRIHKYADGGKVIAPKKKKRVRRSGDTLQSTSVGSTADTLRNRRQNQMDALGLKDGGPVNPLPRPRSGGTPRRITTEGEPGGPHTPGARARRRAGKNGKK